MTKRFRAVIILFLSVFAICTAVARPRLAVVISYDQMRGDYIDRWSKNFGTDGFNLLRNKGAFFASTYFSHAKNITALGHSILLTGCNPAKNGIAGNDFIDDSCNCLRYCVADDTARIYGIDSPIGRSPILLAVPALGDLLIAKYPGSKTAAVAMKDRTAILMAGHKARTVLWFEPDIGKFTTSTYYTLPRWMESFNRRYNCNRYAGRQWQATLPDGKQDDVEFEADFPGGGRVFPHKIPEKTTDKNFVKAFLHTPSAVELLFDAAKSAIIEEKLGIDDQPDLLCVGVSTTDFIGHNFGPDSREIEELYVQCDLILSSFIKFLDERVGRENYVLVLASDHGVSPIPELIRQFGSQPIDAGRLSYSIATDVIKHRFDSIYGPQSNGTQWVRFFDPPNIYLNEAVLESAGIKVDEAAAEALKAVRSVKELAYTATVAEIVAGKIPEGWPEEFARLMRNDIYPGRSGHLVVFPGQYWLYGDEPSSHGTFYDYDRFATMAFLGGEISAKRIDSRADPADIAPTLAALLGVSMPDTDGAARTEIIKTQATKNNRKKKK